ncbi:MAG: AAA family ATPase, partial [Candidatus Tectomicrobia bacterium]|nr:AAA family ATPase [Candidatus Tectomicrobia bacterium]
MPDAERRQLTVMFCDLVDSTSLSSRLDPEVLREVVRDYQATCDTVVQHFDGHIAQYLGDGLLVYFGYPQAHEDDAARAVRAGLGIVEAVTALNTRLSRDKGVRFAIRLGIHTGLVVVGEMGGESRQEQLALGDTPNIASRIERLAAPDTVVISDATYRLVEGYFTCQALGEQHLKGIAQPMPVYRVVEASSARSRLEIATSRGLTPLVGREQEVGLLTERWAQVQEGRGQVVLLSGEAGIGKSRLVQIIKEQVAATSHTGLECRSSPYHRNTALYPIADLLQRILQWQPDETAAQRLTKLEDTLSVYRLPLYDTVPLVAALLSFTLPDNRYPLPQLTPQQQRQKTLETLLTLLLEQAERQPVLFILEDLHWTDPTTLEWLTLLIEQVPTTSLLVVLTCRPEFTSPWGWRSYLTPIALNRFTQVQIAMMASGMVGDKPLPTEVMQHLAEKTDGVPLYIEEMLKAFLESGLLQDTDDQYVLTGPLTSLTVPVTLQDALMARLDHLETAKEMVQLGAVLGRQFSYDVLQAVSHLDDETLQRELARLVQVELLHQRGVAPRASYVFKHALLQDVAYQALLKSTRQAYHQRTVQVLTEHFSETAETQPEVLTYHALRGEVWDQALRYGRQAGVRALEQSAYREAVAHFDQALSALAQLPERRDTLQQAVDLRLDLRNALHPLGEQGRVGDILREAETLAERLGDEPRLGQIACYLCINLSNIGEYDRAIAAGQRALALGTTSGAFDVQVVAQTYLGATYCHVGDFRQALDVSQRAMALLTGEQRFAHFGQVAPPAVASHGCTAWSLAELGGFAEGYSVVEETIRLVEAIEQPYTIALALSFAGLFSRRQGNLHTAIPVLERALALCQSANIPHLLPQAASILGTVYVYAGRIAEALPLLDQVLERVVNGSRMVNLGLVLTDLSEALHLVGRVDEARMLAARLLDRFRPGSSYQAYADRLLGDIAARGDALDTDRAETHYQQALALADELGMRPLQAHCHRGLGTLYGQT